MIPFATGVLALVTAAVTLFVSLRNSRKIEQVHVIVNSRMTSVLERVDQLTAALEAAGTDVPDDPHP